jgi:hypothetical protein
MNVNDSVLWVRRSPSGFWSAEVVLQPHGCPWVDKVALRQCFFFLDFSHFLPVIIPQSPHIRLSSGTVTKHPFENAGSNDWVL